MRLTGGSAVRHLGDQNSFMAKIRVACVRASEAHDCGPAALATVARAHGRIVSLARVRDMCKTDLQGTSLQNLHEAAGKLGFSASFGKIKRDRLKDVPTPAILHLKESGRGHFVVYHGVRDGEIVIADSSRGVVFWSPAKLDQIWSGYGLLLKPGHDWDQEVKPRHPLFSIVKIALRERSTLISLFAMAAALTGLGLAGSFFVQIIVDRIIPEANIHLWTIALIAAVALLLFRGIVTWTRQIVLGKVGSRIELYLGERFVEHVLSLPLSFFQNRTPADVVSRISDISTIRAAVVGTILSVLLDGISLFVAAVVMVFYRPTIAILVIGMLPIVAIFSAFLTRPLVECERHIRISASQLMGELIQSVIHIKLLKAYGVTPLFAAKISQTYDAFQHYTYRRLYLAAVMMTASLIVAGGTSAAVLFIGARLGITGGLRVGQLMFFFTIVGIFVSSLDRLVPSLAFLQEAFAGMERLGDVMSRPQEPAPSTKIDQNSRAGVLSCDAVSFWHRKGVPVLTNLNLHIKKGDTIAVIGETGSGKSTLACLLAGLYLPSMGDVKIDGFSTALVDRLELRELVAIVFQDPGIIDGTIYDNITLGDNRFSDDEIESAAADAMIHEFITELPNGYHYDVGTGGNTLSSGQRQRIALARALLRDTPVLILDEATSCIDVENEIKILDRIYKKRSGRTTIIVTHRLFTAARSERIIVLESGRVAEEGSHHELLLRQGRYSVMWSALGVHARDGG